MILQPPLVDITTHSLEKQWKCSEEAVDYVSTKKGALDSACWFWDTNNINKWCDAMDVVGATKRINGGTIGLDDSRNITYMQ